MTRRYLIYHVTIIVDGLQEARHAKEAEIQIDNNLFECPKSIQSELRQYALGNLERYRYYIPPKDSKRYTYNCMLGLHNTEHLEIEKDWLSDDVIKGAMQIISEVADCGRHRIGLASIFIVTKFVQFGLKGDDNVCHWGSGNTHR
jgi:hypothetical protein